MRAAARRVVDLEGAHGEERAAVTVGAEPVGVGDLHQGATGEDVELLPDLTQREAPTMDFDLISSAGAKRRA